MQIAGIDAQAGVVPSKIAQISREHAVMIAQQGDPILSPEMTLHEIINHAGAVRTTVHQITDVNDGTGAVAGLIGSNPGMGILEKPQLTVDVADGIGSHGRALTLTEKPGHWPPERRDM
jgi:hypothetical protein